MNEIIANRFIGHYIIEKKLAHGGMAEVFLGSKENAAADEPKVVIKRILPELAKDSRFVAMFLNEAQLAAQMNHSNVVKVFEFGEHDGQLFMIMEFVDGLDCWRFSKRLRDWNIDNTSTAVYIVRKVLDALNYAHNIEDVNGKPLMVVHRDLSPSNIYLSRDGSVKLGDFGIARIESNRYRPIEIIPKGKFGYMAPEQVEGKSVDQRSDVYSAGVVLTEMLIRQQLFSGNSQLSVMLNIREGRLDNLENNSEKIPEELLVIIKGALSINKNDRYSCASEFERELAQYQSVAQNEITTEVFAEKVQFALDISDTKKTGDDVGAMALTIGGNEIVTIPVPVPVTSAIPITSAMPTMLVVPGKASGLIQGQMNDDGGQEGTPVTVVSVPKKTQSRGQYFAKIADGTTVGPSSFAHIIELICSEQIMHETLVSYEGKVYKKACEYFELARHLPFYTPTCQKENILEPQRKGFLEFPAEVLLSLAASNEHGLFVCQQSERRKEVYLKRGFATYVGSNQPSELLGEFLIKNNAIDRTELEMALALLPQFNGHLGDTLIALGMMTAVDLFRYIENQIKERLLGLLSWSSGKYEFYPGVDVRAGALEVNINLFLFVRNNLLDKMLTIKEQVLDDMAKTVVSPTALMPEIIDKVMLPSDMVKVIKSVDDWCSVRELSINSDIDPLMMAHTLFVALESGMWTFEGLAPSWRKVKTLFSE